MTEITKEMEKSAVQRMVTAPFLLRIGGLSIDVVDELHFSETVAWIEAILSLETMLTSRKDRLVDVLHATISTYASTDEQALRRKLMKLKRDVFNMRPLAVSEETKVLISTLPTPARELLGAWVDLWEQHQHLLVKGEAIFAQEMCQKRALFKKTIAIDDFRRGIALSSPVLDSAIDAYLASDNLYLNRSQRTVERSLLEYLLRTACKTSPFSTFTSVTSGLFDHRLDERKPDIIYQMPDMEKKSFTRLSMAILSKVSLLITASPALRPELPISLTPGWHVEHGRLRYLRRMQSEEERGEGTVAPMEVVHENVFYLPLGALLTAIIAVLGDGRTIRFHQLLTQLCSLPEFQDAYEEINTYLAHLLRLGLLIVPALSLDTHNKYPLASYRKGLQALGIPAIKQIDDYLGEIDILVAAYATALAAQRRDLLAEVKRLVGACYAILGAEDMLLPPTVIYEDTTIKPQMLAINETSWQQMLASTAEFQQILPMFDLNLPKRLVTKGYFQARYGVGGRCDDFLSFAYEFRQRFFIHYLKNSSMPVNASSATKSGGRLNFFKQSDIERLNDAQQVLGDYMHHAYKGLASGQDELVLGDDFVAALSPHVPHDSASLSSQAYFSQYMQINNEAFMVFNHIYTGFTLMFSRFAHFFDAEEGQQLVFELRKNLRQLQPEGAVFAELKGGYDATNLNLHPQVTAYELVCPGDLSTRPQEEQILLEDLFIQDDGGLGRLRLYSKRLGKEVIPLYLGFLLPVALPEIQQVLFNFSYVTTCMVDLWKNSRRDDEKEDIIFYPRLRYKRLILQRAYWKLRPGVFPQRESGQTDADFFLVVSRWRKKHNFPTRVFVTSDMTLEASSAPPLDTEVAPKRRTYKPLYVDFENYFSLALLEATMRGSTSRMVITEMLPHRDHLWFQQDGQSYVSEFVWEMNTSQGDLNG